MAVFAVLQSALLLRTASDKSDTIDEPHYLATATRQWNEGTLRHNPDSPALPKWGFALALHVSDPALFAPGGGGRDPLWSRPPAQTRRNLMAGRAATIVLTVAAGFFLAAAALRFGAAAALVTHALWCFSPTVLANGSLATLDGWVAAWLAISLWACVHFTDRPGAARAALAGAMLALAASSKVTALAALPIAMVAAAWYGVSRLRQPLRTITAWLCAGATAFVLTLWAASGFETGPIDLTMMKPGTGWPAVQWGFVPFPTWILGLLLQAQHGQSGHLGYLFGRVSGSGWWWFYVAVLALKTTVGAQAMSAAGVVTALRSGTRRRDFAIDAALLAYPVLLFVVMSAGRTQIGARYLLPAFPFWFLWLGAMTPRLAAVFPRRGIAVYALCLALGAAESVAVHPHHLMFFNVWAGGPDGGPRYLVTGDDWGQDQRRLGEWQAVTHPPTLYYTFYSGDPAHWGITYTAPPCTPAPGHYALHAVEVHRPKRIAPGCLDWLTVEPPDARLGHSIYIYQVTRARIARLIAERGTIKPFFASAGRPQSSGDEE